MRLRDLRQKINLNIKLITFETNSKSDGNMVITKYHGIIDAINELEDLLFIESEISLLKEHYNKILYSHTPHVIISPQDFSSFAQLIDTLKMKCQTVTLALNQALPEQNEYSISVKLPPIKNLSEFTDFTHTLDVALSGAIIQEDLKGRVELQNLDTGSNWIEIILGTLNAFNFVGKMVRAALNVTKRMHEHELAKQTLRIATIRADAMQAVEEGLASTVKTLCQYHTDKLIQENNLTTSDGDYSNRLNASIEMLAGLLFKGCEIYQPSIGEASNNKDFPNTTDYKSLDSAINLLTGTTETETETETESEPDHELGD